MKTRTIGIRERNRRLFCFWFCVIVFFVVLVCLCTCGTPRRVVVYESNLMQKAIREQARKEAEFVERFKNGDARSIKTQIVHLGSLTLQDLSQAKVLKKSAKEFKPIPNVMSKDGFRFVPEPKNENLPLLNKESEIDVYLQSSVAAGRELVSWQFKMSDPNPDAKDKEAALKDFGRTSYGWAVADICIGRLKPQRRHLFEIGNASSFNLYDYNNDYKFKDIGRIRVSVSYTDLARMLLILQNNGHSRDLVKRVNDSQDMTTAMLSAYRAIQNMVEHALKADAQEWEKDSNGNLTQYAKALRLHDALCQAVSYDPTMHAADNETLVVSAILGQKATSAGYARTYMLMLSMAGIENVYVNGTKSLGKNVLVDHNWNLVKLDGKWTHVDVSQSDIVPLSFVAKDKKLHAMVSHSAFGLSDDQMRRLLGLTLESTEWKSMKKSLDKGEIDDSLYYYKQPFLKIGNAPLRHRVFTSASDLAKALIQRAAAHAVYSDEYLISGITVEALQEAITEEYELSKEQLRFNVQMSTPDKNGVRFISVSVQE